MFAKGNFSIIFWKSTKYYNVLSHSHHEQLLILVLFSEKCSNKQNNSTPMIIKISSKQCISTEW
jgi:hypothetical protein